MEIPQCSLGEPVAYPQVTREAVGAAVRLALGTDHDLGSTTTHEDLRRCGDALAVDFTHVLHEWGQPGLAEVVVGIFGEALTEAYLAVEMTRFMTVAMRLVDEVPTQSLLPVAGTISAIQDSALATGDWAWAATFVTEVLDQMRATYGPPAAS
jgi:hypothetical protein